MALAGKSRAPIWHCASNSTTLQKKATPTGSAQRGIELTKVMRPSEWSNSQHLTRKQAFLVTGPDMFFVDWFTARAFKNKCSGESNFIWLSSNKSWKLWRKFRMSEQYFTKADNFLKNWPNTAPALLKFWANFEI